MLTDRVVWGNQLSLLKPVLNNMSSTKLQTRINFGKIKHLAETPDLLEVTDPIF